MAHYQNEKSYGAFDRQRDIKEVCYQVFALLLIQLLLPVLVFMDLAIRLGKRLSR